MAGVIIGGWYTKFYSPPRVQAAVVNDTIFTQGDLVKRVRMIQAAQGYESANIDVSTILRVLYNPEIDVSAGPFNLGMVQMELLRQFASQYSVTVEPQEVTDGIRAVFRPEVEPGQQATADQLEREYQERYRTFLNRFRTSDSDYRRIVGEQLYFVKMLQAIGAEAPTEADHVEVSWLEIPVRPDPSLGDPSKFQDINGIKSRLQKEDFTKVAGEFAAAFQHAEDTGYVGWVPRGAFPKLDPHLFGSSSQQALAVNQVSEPIFAGQYYYFVKVSAGPQKRNVESEWKDRLQRVALETWLSNKFDEGTSAGWLKVNYNSEIYSWAAKQLNQTARQKRGQ
ncbi:MAG: hypothetical protein FJ320_00375 [SAR202 cluster bacterium]|nr:hypothetical protein [SAR202 cluster bacterium]